MKIIIFSDTHLGPTFEQKKFDFLVNLINKSGQVIIAGDFWEGRLLTFDQFLNSMWKALFPLLKKKKTIYIFGNHDPKNLMDSQANKFSSSQRESYSFTSGKQNFLVKHGHQDIQKYPLLELFSKNKVMFELLHSLSEKILVVMFGKNALQILFRRYNKKIKSRVKIRKNEILITGHTHAAEMDLDNKYINTGLIRHGVGQYLLIENGKIEFVEEKY